MIFGRSSGSGPAIAIELSSAFSPSSSAIFWMRSFVGGESTLNLTRRGRGTSGSAHQLGEPGRLYPLAVRRFADEGAELGFLGGHDGLTLARWLFTVHGHNRRVKPFDRLRL